jgi:hypothetical protein
MEYFGLTIYTESMSVKIPEETIKKLLGKLHFFKVTSKQLQSLCGSLAFCTRALAPQAVHSAGVYI